MIKVLEEKKVPKAQVKCNNCGSLLEYGNADLSVDYDAENNMNAFSYPRNAADRPQCIICPVCGCKVCANWVVKKEKEL